MGGSNGDGDGGGVDGDGPWAIPRPGRVPEQSFCPPKLGFDGGGVAELFRGKHRLF